MGVVNTVEPDFGHFKMYFMVRTNVQLGYRRSVTDQLYRYGIDDTRLGKEKVRKGEGNGNSEKPRGGKKLERLGMKGKEFF